jgi:arsenite methyltransferase
VNSLLAELTELEIKEAVRRKYAGVALRNEPCCGPQAITIDESLPKESVASAASCGSPVLHASLRQGDVVLDLGSGGGIDVFRASKLVESTGKVIGVDSTPEMIFKARESAKKYAYNNVEFRLGEIEHLPVEGDSVDVVISNCVLNLVPDKALAFREIHRVLKPGGRIAVSDMVATTKFTQPIDPDEWAECIAGAVTMEEYGKLLQEAGFQNIRHLDESSPVAEKCCSDGIPVKSVAWFATKSQR